ncbi:DUF1232 domain-containing protein [Candidatus Binatia bacterium]|jgi:uncharacterized membrane protein YkvA (DUF1232 family)|nr:DUF1232 domain-containing protein [Candidatus Binatia bacterium]
MSQWAEKLRALKVEAIALYLAARHPGTPWYAKLLVACVAAYALSPIDLIPDFIPLLGYADDALLLPIGMVLARWMVPGAVMHECRTQAESMMSGARPTSRIAATLIVSLWVGFTTLAMIYILRLAA